MRLAGYLEAVSSRLVIDLVTVSQYQVGGQAVIVPQRVDPGREREDRVERMSRPFATANQQSVGADEFVASIDPAMSEAPAVRMVIDWAMRLEREGLARLMTTKGRVSTNVRVRLLDEDGGPVTVWKASNGVSIAVWGSVLGRRAPGSLAAVEQALAPKELKSEGATYPDSVTADLLDALTAAYREAATRDEPVLTTT
jgi:hypothetical protein